MSTPSHDVRASTKGLRGGLCLEEDNISIFLGEKKSTSWLTKFTNSESTIFSFPRYRHICLRAPSNDAYNAIYALQTYVSHVHVYIESCSIT